MEKFTLDKQNTLKEDKKNILNALMKEVKAGYIGQSESMEKKTFYLK